MSTATVTTLAFVRTASGVVRVEKGGPVPTDALEAEVERLVTAGVVVTSDDSGDQGSGEALGGSGDPAPVGDTPRGGKSRGRSGSGSKDD